MVSSRLQTRVHLLGDLPRLGDYLGLSKGGLVAHLSLRRPRTRRELQGYYHGPQHGLHGHNKVLQRDGRKTRRRGNTPGMSKDMKPMK